ncbi:MAG: peptidase S10 [Myxococcota bacterium]
MAKQRDKDPATRSANSGDGSAGQDTAADDAQPPVVDTEVTTEHSITLGGAALHYTATAGTLVVRDERDMPRASIFHVSYTVPCDDPAERPLTFVFNGGPGSAALWLMLGALGPRRVEVSDATLAPAPPYRVVDNPHTLLDVTDLVFIDPVRTGLSRPEGEAKDDDFLGLEQDLASLAELIRLYVTRHARWASPKYLAGESYGSMRAAGLLGTLHDKGMAFNGALLISVVLDLTTLLAAPHYDLPAILHLPSFAATAWYHGMVSGADSASGGAGDLAAFVDEVRTYATTEYTLALMRGARLPEDRAAAVAEAVHRYTGLSPRYVRNARLRLDTDRFCKELLRERGQTVGRLDSRFVGRDVDDAGEHCEHDPSLTAVLAPFNAAVQDHLRRELKVVEDRPYLALNLDANENWQWHGKGKIGGPSTVELLRKAMLQNPGLRLFVANGYFDLATPFLAVEHTFDHLGLSAGDLDRVVMKYYEAGHMMYLHPPSLTALARDMHSFYTGERPAD